MADETFYFERPRTGRGLTREELLRRGAVGMLFLSGGSLLAACGGGEEEGGGGGAETEAGGPKRGGTIQVSFSDASTKENLDPALSTLSNDSFYTGQIYQGLTVADTDWNVHPVLAEKWEANDDATEWTFTLRQGVKFHDGSPFTSKDAAYSLGRLLDEDLGSPLFARLEPSLAKDGIQTPDDATLVLRLKRPDSLMPVALSARHAMIVKNGTKDFTLQTAVGTGPFKITQFQPGRGWEVERNPNYWEKGLPYLDGLRGVVIGEQSTKVQSVTSGQSHIADPIDYSAASTVKGSGAAELLEFKGATYLLVAMDQTKEPFNDERVVDAIKMAVDRERVLQAVFQGYGDVTADVPVPPDDPFYPSGLETGQDIEGAKRLLAEAGYENGIDLELFTSASYGGMVDLAAAFQQVVEPAGIRVKINQGSPDTYWDQVWLVKPMYVSYYTRRHPNEILSVTYASNAPWNEAKLKNEELDQLLSQGLKTTDEEEQKEIYEQALREVNDKHGTAIPAFASKLWVKKKNVRGEQLELSRGMLMQKAYLA
ncbi:MAG: ABC transporter substrate-binding protein [Actinomycetota bacterium]|nr:ABC transporter substrate-binding protein [Actinomycetota bacterium]